VDLVLIDDLYSKIDERNRLIEENVANETALKNLNLELLQMTNIALKEIDWKKYLTKK
jgi:hypothetical protein